MESKSNNSSNHELYLLFSDTYGGPGVRIGTQDPTPGWADQLWDQLCAVDPATLGSGIGLYRTSLMPGERHLTVVPGKPEPVRSHFVEYILQRLAALGYDVKLHNGKMYIDKLDKAYAVQAAADRRALDALIETGRNIPNAIQSIDWVYRDQPGEDFEARPGVATKAVFTIPPRWAPTLAEQLRGHLPGCTVYHDFDEMIPAPTILVWPNEPGYESLQVDVLRVVQTLYGFEEVSRLFPGTLMPEKKVPRDPRRTALNVEPGSLPPLPEMTDAEKVADYDKLAASRQELFQRLDAWERAAVSEPWFLAGLVDKPTPGNLREGLRMLRGHAPGVYMGPDAPESPTPTKTVSQESFFAQATAAAKNTLQSSPSQVEAPPHLGHQSPFSMPPEAVMAHAQKTAELGERLRRDSLEASKRIMQDVDQPVLQFDADHPLTPSTPEDPDQPMDPLELVYDIAGLNLTYNTSAGVHDFQFSATCGVEERDFDLTVGLSDSGPTIQLAIRSQSKITGVVELRSYEQTFAFAFGPDGGFDQYETTGRVRRLGWTVIDRAFEPSDQLSMWAQHVLFAHGGQLYPREAYPEEAVGAVRCGGVHGRGVSRG